MNKKLSANTIRMLRLYIGAFFFLCIGGFSCKKPDFSVPGVQPDSEKLGLVFSDSATIISFTLPDDSILTNKTSLNLLGIYNDPVFGKSEAQIYTQIRLSEENKNLGAPGDLAIDSIILSLAYSGLYGKASAQNFKVFELSENMYADSNYYSTKTFQYNPSPIGNLQNATPKIYDSVSVGGINEPPQLRIHLLPSFGYSLLTAGDNVYAANDNFLQYFKGIHIKSEYTGAPAAGEGGIIYFNLLSAYSKITIYYRNVVLGDTLKFDFNINDTCARMTNFKLDHSGTPVFSADIINGNSLIYIQSMSGAKAKILLPHLENFVENGKIAVHKAEIIFTAEENSTNEFSPHANLFLTNIDSAGNAGYLIDQFEGENHYGGAYNPVAGQYVFNITRHLQFLTTRLREGENYNYGMYLMASGKAVNANRTILKGNKNSNGGVQLKISYTPL